MARPPFEPTAEQHRLVAVAAGAGVQHEVIAIALGIARNTLRKHFAEDLAGGAAQRRLEVLEALHAAAMRGNVAAQKGYLALTAVAATVRAPRVKPAPPKPGKKEQRAAAAKRVSETGRFVAGRPPLRAVPTASDA